MNGSGFHLVRLALTGPSVEMATVEFTTGLNVIAGPSDTGKSFILECIDFMLGAGDSPKDVPEASSYDKGNLVIRSNDDGSEISLHRNLRGGAFTATVNNGEALRLGERHAADRADTLSHFLLELVGLSDKRVLKSRRTGETISLSFRHLAHLVVIPEQKVQSARPPIEMGQHPLRVSERAVFRLLLSGVDDSTVVESDDRRISKVRVETRVDVLQELVARANREIEDLAVQDNLDELRDRLDRQETNIQQVSAELNKAQGDIALAEQKRRSAWQQLRQVDSRLDVLSELEMRFELLGRQYASDLRRLEAIAETGSRLDQLEVERCPICGALPEHHELDHGQTQTSVASVAVACATEAQKIRVLVKDLDETRTSVKGEIEKLRADVQSHRTAMTETVKAIQDELRPRMQDAVAKFREYQESRQKLRHAFSLLEQKAELEEMIADALDQPLPSAPSIEGRELNASDLEAFCKEVEDRLRAWHFPGLGRVTFSEADWDIVISGTRRGSHGKGVRAVTHAAFTLALLQYCANRELPHPGFVVIDSPLIVYREPDVAEKGFSLDVKPSFYKDLAATFVRSQVIILENDDPPPELVSEGALNLIKFTGSTIGRRGFIPANRRT